MERTGSVETESERLFRLTCEAILEDGHVETWESQLMQHVATMLGLDQPTALAIFRDVRAAGGNGSPSPQVEQERLTLYGRLMRRIVADGEVDNLEHKALHGLRLAFHVTDDQHRQLVRSVTSG